MKNSTAICCTIAICAALIYHARTRPGRYYFPNTWSNMRVGDTVTGRIFLIQDSSTGHDFFVRDPERETFKWPWE